MTAASGSAALEDYSPALPPMPEHEVRECYELASTRYRSLLDELARHPARPRTFREVEAALGWNRGVLASVLGGSANRAKARWGGRRPHSIARSGGSWWIGMDEERAAIIEVLSGSRLS